MHKIQYCNFNIYINLLFVQPMSNLNEIEKHRLKLYGEMLKNDLL